MTQSRRILWLALFAVAITLMLPLRAAAQNFVTPTIAPTPGIGTTGQFVVVNNTAGSQYTDPHVSGDLVCFSSALSGAFTVHYFHLPAGPDTQIPNPDTTLNQDFLCDVRGSVIAFTRSAPGMDTIMTLDTSVTQGQPVQVSPSTLFAYGSAIGDATIVLGEACPENSTCSRLDVFAYDRATGATVQIDPLIAGALNRGPNISPDGTVAVWASAQTGLGPFTTWKATLANNTWAAQQLQSQGQSDQRPDTDGNIITYASIFTMNGVPVVRVTWQPVNPTTNQVTEQVLDTGDVFDSNPSTSAGYIAFDKGAAGEAFNDLAVYDVANNILYNVTADLAKVSRIPPQLRRAGYGHLGNSRR